MASSVRCAAFRHRLWFAGVYRTVLAPSSRSSPFSDIGRAMPGERRLCAACLRREREECFAQELERPRIDAVTAVRSLDRAGDNAGVLEHLEMLGDGGLSQWERLDKVADDALAPGGQHLDDAEAHRVGERPQEGDGAGLVGCR